MLLELTNTLVYMPFYNIILVKSELSFNHLDNDKTANINDLNVNYIHLISGFNEVSCHNSYLLRKS